MSTEPRQQRLVFGEVAELYDRFRPGYPDAAFDRIVEYGRLGAGDAVLELGCGTGRATLLLAAKGLSVTALEPSAEMARLATQKTVGLAGVAIVEASFEEWLLPEEPFRLVTSAQAWHWLQPAVRFVKAHDALRAQGPLALIWNVATGIDASDSLEEQIEEVYRRVAPGLAARVPGEPDLDRRLEIEASGLFVDVERELYPWSITYSTEEYLGLLQTQSDHRLLEPDTRELLMTGIAEVLADHGNALPQEYRTVLYLARRRP
ncbi:MAG: class I SAM-dependent methyltransferase [Candidatus Dormiibacterota bacterium]